MKRLDSLNIRYLRREHFLTYPLWVWDDTNEGRLPISDSKYTTEFGTLFFKANVKSQQPEINCEIAGVVTVVRTKIRNLEAHVNICNCAV